MKATGEDLTVVVFSCGDLGYEIAKTLVGRSRIGRVTLVTAPYVRKPLSLMGKIRLVHRRQGWGGLVSAILKKTVRLLIPNGKTHTGQEFVYSDPQIQHFHFSDFHAPECLHRLRQLAPDLGVIAGTYILKKDVFEIPKLGSVNLHSGKAPEYRGAAPAFWELYNGEPHVGITIHQLSPLLDEGPIFLQELFPLDSAPDGDPLEYLERYRTEVLRPNGIRLVTDAVLRIANGTLEPKPQDHSRARTYRTPEYKDIVELRRRIMQRRQQRGQDLRTTFKRTVKSVLGYLIFRSGLHQAFLQNKAVVVLFHRISDRYRGNPISCTREEFQQFCDFFARYFRVVPLGELLEKLVNNEVIGRHLVITFDDGYKDNFSIAAQELHERQLPACFFVCTDFIESSHVPWWDAERDVASEWMSWSNLRSLHKQGFEIGSHTMTHIDLGKTRSEDAEREIDGSKRRLETELGAGIRYFSYPYGGRNNICEENRELIRQAGFACCLSAYGGIVSRTTDPFNIERTPISQWYVSPYQFGFEMLFTQ